MEESALDRAMRRVRNGEEAGTWNDDKELAWLKRHPEDRKPGWQHPTEFITDDLIPDPGRGGHDTDELEPYLDKIDILDAYHRWGVKGFTANPGSKRESIKIRCPDPMHPDNDPSAWINLDKQVYMCRPCGHGGDLFTIGAYHYGVPVTSDGKIDPSSFRELRRRIAEDFGFLVSRTPGGTKYVEDRSVPEQPEEVAEADEPEPAEALAPIVGIIRDDLDEEQLDALTSSGIMIDWQSIVPPETFMWDWMHATTVDDLPHEYYFMLGLMALASAAGPDAYLTDFRPVYGNLFLCLYGGTGSGKSRALAPFQELLEAAIPYDPDPTKPSTGTKFLPAPGSSEALIHSFTHPLLDPATGTPSATLTAPVRGLLRIEEFASFVSRSNRVGNPMKETLIELYDAYGRDVKHYARGAGLTIAHSPYCQVVTTTQPRAIHGYLSRMDADSGFMNRWLFAVGKRRVARISHGGFKMDISDAIHQLKAVKAWASSGREMDLVGDAARVWDDFYQDTITPLYDDGDESMFSRIDLTLKKIIILLTCNEKLSMPTAEIVEKAIKLYPYMRTTYRMFARDVRANDDEMCQEAVIKSINAFEKKTGKGPTLRELAQRLSKTYSFKIIERSIQVLEILDMITVQIARGARGPETKRYSSYVG